MIGAVLLAAGASRRMGQPKALLQLGGQTLLARVTRTAEQAGAQTFSAVVGPPHGLEIRAAHTPSFSPHDFIWAWNDQPERGMLSSVQAGLRHLPDGVLGALIWPVDIPFVAVTTVRALLGANLSQLIIPVHRGRGGHPLWLPRALFGETLSLPPEEGLRALRNRHPPLRFEVEDEKVLHDLDTPEDLAQLTQGAQESAPAIIGKAD